MQCPRCAKTLPGDVRFCHFCGSPLATPEPGAGGTSPNEQPANDKINVGAQSLPFQTDNTAPAAPAPGEASFAFQEFGNHGVPLPESPGIATPYLFPLPFPAPYPPPTPAASTPAQTKRRGLSTGWIVLCAMLAIVLLFTGLGVALYVVGSHTLASDNAANNATKTAAMQLYQQVTTTLPAEIDPLTNPSSSVWSPYQRAQYGCAEENDGLHVHISDKEHLAYCLNGSSEFANVAFQVQMQILSGDAGGLVFRLNELTQQSYFFQVGLNGFYGVFTSKDPTKNASTLTKGVTQAVEQSPSSTNTLTIIAKGSTFDFYINMQFLAQVQDTTFTNGYIGVLASDNTQSTEVLYTDARIWNLDA